MDRELLVASYMVLIVINFILSTGIFIGYTVLAPWYKYSAGRQVAGLLGALTLLFGVSVVRLFFREWFPFTGELMLLMIGVLTIALAFLGWGIFNVQIRHYRKVRRIKKHTPTIQNRSHRMAGENSPEVDNNDGD